MTDIVADTFAEYRSWHAVRLVWRCLARNIGDACLVYWTDCERQKGRGTRRW